MSLFINLSIHPSVHSYLFLWLTVPAQPAIWKWRRTLQGRELIISLFYLIKETISNQFGQTCQTCFLRIFFINSTDECHWSSVRTSLSSRADIWTYFWEGENILELSSSHLFPSPADPHYAPPIYALDDSKFPLLHEDLDLMYETSLPKQYNNTASV